MDSRADENSSIEPILIIVKSIKCLMKAQTCDNLEECMGLFNLVTDHNVVCCDGKKKQNSWYELQQKSEEKQKAQDGWMQQIERNES